MLFESRDRVAPSFPRDSNLDWLRLASALQVVLVHFATHLDFALPPLVEHFPGVPAFFFISGLLVYASCRNAPGRPYFENRCLRIFPGLVFATLGGAAVALIAHGRGDLFDHFPTYAVWFLAQITLGQAYNPALFRDVGTGVVNGALWTLTVELLFYACVPLVIAMERRFRHALPALLAVSFLVYAIGPLISGGAIYRNKTAYDVVALTPLAWGWMFGYGILAGRHFNHVKRWLKHAPWLAAPMLLMLMQGDGVWFGASGNRLGMFYFVCYAGLLLWFGFALPVVRMPWDISYGVYVWHLPVINLLLVLAIPSAALAIVLTCGMAALSCFAVERPALRLKRRSLKQVRA